MIELTDWAGDTLTVKPNPDMGAVSFTAAGEDNYLSIDLSRGQVDQLIAYLTALQKG
ncbi:hypothetical protein SEA_RAHALELUJAH_91 [Mycobacterium phage Rahalelujah]|nr:hypothetical protein SEA_RAHALELUJAH_91 [Mycobacterium phage Rahalelujah]